MVAVAGIRSGPPESPPQVFPARPGALVPPAATVDAVHAEVNATAGPGAAVPAESVEANVGQSG
jgi:hypothetical protein